MTDVELKPATARAFAQEVPGIPRAVQEALVVLAAGGERGALYVRAVTAVRELEADLSGHRIKRLVDSGFSAAAAQRTSGLHAKRTGDAM